MESNKDNKEEKLKLQANLLSQNLSEIIGDGLISEKFGFNLSTFLLVVSSSEQDNKLKGELEKLNFEEEKVKVNLLLESYKLKGKDNPKDIMDLYCDFCAKILLMMDNNLYRMLVAAGIKGKNCFECIENINHESTLHPVITRMVEIKKEEIQKGVTFEFVLYNLEEKEKKEKEKKEKEEKEAREKEAREKEEKEAREKEAREKEAREKEEKKERESIECTKLIQLNDDEIRESEIILNEKENKFVLEELKNMIISRLNSFSFSRFLKGCLKSIFSCLSSCFIDQSDNSLTKKQMIQKILKADDYETIDNLCKQYKDDDIIPALKRKNNCKAYLAEMEKALSVKDSKKSTLRF